MEFTVQVEKPSHILRKLTIHVPAKTVNSRLEKGLVEMQRTVKLKGFRQGHVPLAVVKQYYGEDVRHQVFHNLIDESYQNALREQKIQAIGNPTIETPKHKTGAGAHDHSIDEGEGLTYTATVEILPEIEVKNYTKISLTQDKTEVVDSDVDAIVKNLQESRAELIPVPGVLTLVDGSESSRPVQKGDHVDMNFVGGVITPTGIEERADMKGNRLLEIGSDSLIPGFEEHLVGMRRGETKTFRIHFPKDFYEKDLAEKEAEFTVTIQEVKEKKVPELNDEFAKQLSYDDILDMRQKARAYLESQKAQESDRKLKSDLLQALIDKHSFEVPSSLVQAQTRALAQDVASHLKQQGLSEEMIKDTLTSELDRLKKRAENQVRASLILEAIAKKENIQVPTEEVEAEISQISRSMKVEEEKLREYYVKNPGRKEDLEFRMREERTVQFLLGKAQIKKEK